VAQIVLHSSLYTFKLLKYMPFDWPKMSSDANFEFIQQHSNNAISKKTRTKIRKQAMRGVAAARRRRAPATNWRSNDAVSLPSHLIPNPAAPLPTSGLELLVKDKGLDPMDLSALTSIHIGEV
jgi:hypothetical protein